MNSTHRDVMAVVLAGGEGKRFRPYTDLIPKPMIPIGPEEKPLLEHIVRWLSRYGISRFLFLVGYRWRQVANYFGDGSRFGVRIDYSLDDEKYSDTGGALLKARREGLLDSGVALVWYGDILAPLDVKDLIESHRRTGADVTLVLADRYQVPVGVAEVDEDGNVVEMREKPWINVKVTVGILAIRPEVLDPAEGVLGTSFDVMGDLIPWLIREGYRVKAYIYRGPWYDVGSLERYHKLPEGELREFIGQG